MTTPSGALVPTTPPTKTELAFRTSGRFRVNGRGMSIHAYRQLSTREWIVTGCDYSGKPIMTATWPASLTQDKAISRAWGRAGGLPGRKPRGDSAAENRVTVRFTASELEMIQRVALEGETLAATVRRLALTP
jgi:hypothetical protein